MKQCMIVDDSASIRKVAKRVLNGIDVRGLEAENADQALRMCGKRMPDAVMVDWNIPDTNSLHLIAKLRRLPGGQRLKILYCMSEVDEDAIRRARAQGADGYILKPFDEKTMRTALRANGLG